MIIKTKPILDIFSRNKKRKTEIKKTKIIIDHQEKSSPLIEELENFNFEIDFKRLKVADYLLRGVAIERKTVQDFIGSMKNRRLLRQLEEIQQYKNRLLIIEGIDEQDLYSDDFSENQIGMHPNSVRGFLLSILLNYKVPIIFTKDYKDTAKFMDVLARRKKTEISLNVNKKSLNVSERTQFILEGFPGVGPKTAKKLLQEFKTLKNIFNASEEELKEILGKKAESFINILNNKYKLRR